MTFVLSESDREKPEASQVTLLVPVPRGNGGYWVKMADLSSRSTASETPTGAASGMWSEKGVPSLRAVATAQLRDDGLLTINYAIEQLPRDGATPNAFNWASRNSATEDTSPSI